MNTDNITFSFGDNWLQYSENISDEDISAAIKDIQSWLGGRAVGGRTVLDIGSGSGIHSLAFMKLGAKSVHSFDFDENSVESTKRLWAAAGKPSNWTIEHGSILDSEYLERLGQFNIVYSWGVLHHTGSMWAAIANAYSLVAAGGVLWISIYQHGPQYQKHLQLKQKYNNSSALGKRYLEARRIVRVMLSRARNRKNPLAWNVRTSRGMNVYHDIVDWLGGLPYETANEDQVIQHARERGFVLERISVRPEGACSIYVFRALPTNATGNSE